MTVDMIKLLLYKNHLNGEQNDYFARIKYTGVLNNEDIADLIIGEGSEYQKESIIDILNRSDRIKMRKLAQGYRIKTMFFNTHISVKGHFEGASSSFDANKHQLNVKFSATKSMREKLRNSLVEVLGTAQTNPVVGQVTDVLTQACNQTISPNQVIEIKGKRIKIAGDDARIGIYLIMQNSGQRIHCNQIVCNEPKRLLVVLPELQAGSYALEIITQYSNARKQIKHPVSTRFQHLLHVK